MQISLHPRLTASQWPSSRQTGTGAGGWRLVSSHRQGGAGYRRQGGSRPGSRGSRPALGDQEKLEGFQPRGTAAARRWQAGREPTRETARDEGQREGPAAARDWAWQPLVCRLICTPPGCSRKHQRPDAPDGTDNQRQPSVDRLLEEVSNEVSRRIHFVDPVQGVKDFKGRLFCTLSA